MQIPRHTRKMRVGFVAGATLVLASAIPAHALEQDDIDSLGRILGATNEAVQRFGEAGETLKDLGKNDFVGAGTGSVKRGLARGWNEALQPWKDASERVREGLPFKIVGKAFQVSDWVSPVGSLSGGDVRGTVSGATQIVVGGTAAGTGAAFFGAVGTGAGAVVGSFFPVVGNIVGAEIGGAIGTVAGGFISSYGYDKYLKDYVGAGVERGFAAVFDSDPLKDAMRARQAFLHQNLSPELAEAFKTSLGFGGGEAQIVDWERVPYAIVKPQQPGAAPTPVPEQQAALPPVGAPTGAFQIDPGDPQVFNCTIAAGVMRCEGSYALGLARWQYLFEGTLNGTTATGTQSTILDQRYQSGCGYRELMQWPARYEFEDGGRVRVSQSPGTVKLLSNSCPVPPRSVMPSSSSSGVTTWRARQ
jgi:hypothetical protein